MSFIKESHTGSDVLLLKWRKKVTSSSNAVDDSVVYFSIAIKNLKGLGDPRYSCPLSCLRNCNLCPPSDLLHQFIFLLSYQVAIPVLQLLTKNCEIVSLKKRCVYVKLLMR